MIGIVYKATCRANGKAYIGQTFTVRDVPAALLVKRRKRRHERTARLGGDTPFHLAIRAHRPDQFGWDILHTADSVDELNSLEIAEIVAHDSMVGRHGYNAYAGGRNRIPNDLTKKKMSDAAKRRWASPGVHEALADAIRSGRAEMPPESRQRLRDAAKAMHTPEVLARAAIGRAVAIRSPEQRAARSLTSLAIWARKNTEERRELLDRGLHSPASRAAARETMRTVDRAALRASIRKRLRRPFVVFDSRGGIVGKFEHIIDAAVVFAVHEANISACLRGKAKSFAGMWARWLPPESKA